MKTSHKKTDEQGIKKITLLSSTIIILIVATIIGSVLIKTEYSNFKKHIKSFKKTLIEREKFYIKTSVENLKNDIKSEELSILNNKKHRIKTQSIIAYNLANSLYKKTNKLSKQEQINLIKSSIKQLAQKEHDINYFILDTKGNLILNSESSNDENQNFLDFEDINGKRFINEMIDKKNNLQNFTEYFWYKPNSSITAKKITFSRHLKELGLIIGSGSYLVKQNNELKNKLLKKISHQNYDSDEYVFIYKINSLKNIKNQSELLIQKHIISNKYEYEAIEKLLMNTNYKGNDYLFYQNKNKLIYASFISDLRYFIAVGVDLTKIYKIVEKERDISFDNMYKKIIQFVIVISIMTIIFFIFSILFTKKLTNIFEEYKKNVILNEEKYHLLFNHSNDAFLISKITDDNKAKIISSNKTATKVTFYSKDDLCEKYLFDLFFDLDLKQILKDNSFLGTVQMKTQNNDIKTIELNIAIYTDGNQKLLFASLRDITERTLLKIEKAKQEKILIQKSKMASMGEMIANIAHQWRQPLSQISGLFFDIDSAYTYKELNKKYLDERVNEANDLLEYMSKTIDDFRNFFNPNSKKEDFLIKDAVLNATKIVKSMLEINNIKLIVQVENDYKINGYKNEYSQAIMNIITNAKDILIERSIQNPCIKIYLEENEKVVLCIEDNANGVNKDIIEKIFDPYFTTKYDYGTGIGLYMTKLIIEEKMNGSIKVININQGAKFSIEI